MGLQDLIITPIYFFILLSVAYIIRPLVTNKTTKPYFIPGLLFKFFGAIALGLIYQFYYDGGDTFNYHAHGSRWIWQAIMDNPVKGIQLLFISGTEHIGALFQYTSHIWYYRDPNSYMIIKIAAFFDLFTLSTYSATALFFASFSFSGLWALFSILNRIYPYCQKHIAIAVLFVPSVIFWGSGLLKDTLTLGALGWITYCMFQIVIFKKNKWILPLLFFAWMIYSIKIYILICFVASAIVFLYKYYINAIKSGLIRLFMMPFLLSIFISLGFLIMDQISQRDSRYSLTKISETARITAYDIRYGWGARLGDNSGYTLGELDGSIESLLLLAPKGIIVSLFRPWPWEIKNPLMFIASIESFTLILLTLYMLYKVSLSSIWKLLNQPVMLYCLCFALLFAFAVGVSTYNFGTLMRYKIPLMPFYSIFIAYALKYESITNAQQVS